MRIRVGFSSDNSQTNNFICLFVSLLTVSSDTIYFAIRISHFTVYLQISYDIFHLLRFTNKYLLRTEIQVYRDACGEIIDFDPRYIAGNPGVDEYTNVCLRDFANAILCLDSSDAETLLRGLKYLPAGEDNPRLLIKRTSIRWMELSLLTSRQLITDFI